MTWLSEKLLKVEVTVFPEAIEKSLHSSCWDTKLSTYFCLTQINAREVSETRVRQENDVQLLFYSHFSSRLE